MAYTRSGLSGAQERLSLRYLLVAIRSYYPGKHVRMPIFCKEELGAKQSLSEPCLAFYHFSCGLGFSLCGHCLISSSIWTQLLHSSWAQEHPGKFPVPRRSGNDFQDLMSDIKACSLVKSAAGFSNDIKNKGDRKFAIRSILREGKNPSEDPGNWFRGWARKLGLRKTAYTSESMEGSRRYYWKAMVSWPEWPPAG